MEKQKQLKKRTSWRKGLTKDTDKRLKKFSESCKGRKHSEETKRKIGLKHKGKKLSEETKRKIGLKSKGRMIGYKHTDEAKRKISQSQLREKGNNWTGENVTYRALHKRIRKEKPKPKFCEGCGKEEPREVANISGEYKYDIDDYEWLCKKCHVKKDGVGEKLKKFGIKNRRKHKGELVRCTRCKKYKTKDNFYKSKRSWDKLGLYCKKCVYEKYLRRKNNGTP